MRIRLTAKKQAEDHSSMSVKYISMTYTSRMRAHTPILLTSLTSLAFRRSFSLLPNSNASACVSNTIRSTSSPSSPGMPTLTMNFGRTLLAWNMLTPRAMLLHPPGLLQHVDAVEEVHAPVADVLHL